MKGPMMKKLPITLTALALALAALALAACGSSSSSSSSTTAATTSSSTTAAGGSGGTVKFEADPSGKLAYTQTQVTAKAGNDTIQFDNPSSLTHDVVIEDKDGNQVAATDQIAGSSTSTTADLQPGTYTFFCSVDSHREAGMQGTLTVK
jgi:plastocyanin